MPRVKLTKSVMGTRFQPLDPTLSIGTRHFPGSEVKVTPKGRKVFIVLISHRRRWLREVECTIGPYGRVTLHQDPRGRAEAISPQSWKDAIRPLKSGRGSGGLVADRVEDLLETFSPATPVPKPIWRRDCEAATPRLGRPGPAEAS